IPPQQHVVNELSGADTDPTGLGGNALFRRGVVVWRITQNEHLLQIAHYVFEERMWIIRRLRNQARPELRIAHGLNLLCERQICDRAVAGIQRERVITELEPEQCTRRSRKNLALDPEALARGLLQVSIHLTPLAGRIGSLRIGE